MQKQDFSRRSFLKTGAIAAGTMAVGGGVFGALNTPAVAAEVPAWPWPYVRLDAQQAEVDSYAGYGQYKCSYGAFHGIIKQLREKVGYPYDTVLTESLMWGGTGGSGWTTLCGALIGAATAINYVIGPNKKDVDKVVSELFGWYTTAEFPQYIPPAGKALKYEGAMATSVAGSPLCHVSVSNWCAASGLKAEGKERSERCGRLTADVVAKTVELLNDYHNGKFTAAYKTTQSAEECMTCHGKGRSLENTRGKMDCIQCHDDVDLNNLVDHIKKEWTLK